MAFSSAAFKDGSVAPDDAMLSAPTLLKIFDSVYVLALTAWVGAILFFSFGVAPIIFKVLDPASAAKFVRALFPRYYTWGAIAAALALPSYLAGPLSFPEYRGPWVGVQAFAMIAGALIMLYSGNSLTPAINAARDAGPSGQALFDKLHKRSVRLNGVALLIGVALLTAFAARPAPRTAGILEMTPAERAVYDAKVGRAIEQIEAREGLRPPLRDAEVSAPNAGLDAATVRELEEIYAVKRARDAAKAAASKR